MRTCDIPRMTSPLDFSCIRAGDPYPSAELKVFSAVLIPVLNHSSEPECGTFKRPVRVSRRQTFLVALKTSVLEFNRTM